MIACRSLALINTDSITGQLNDENVVFVVFPVLEKRVHVVGCDLVQQLSDHELESLE